MRYGVSDLEGMSLLKTCHVLRGHVLRGRVRGWWYSLLVFPLALAALSLASISLAEPIQPGDRYGTFEPHEPFKQGGPIGSQTPDGYNALGPVVTQPIEFPHYIHVEKMGIDCLYCHTYARRSAVSGIPRLNKCIGCHQSIESVKDKPRIKLLLDYWDKKQAIPWKKVHDRAGFRALQSRAPYPALHLPAGAPDARGLRLLPRRCGIDDHGAPRQGHFDGMVHQLS